MYNYNYSLQFQYDILSAEIGKMTIKVKVYAPGFINHEPIDPNGYVELTDNDSLNSLYKKLRVPVIARPVLTSFVNYEPARLNTRLKDGDVVSLLFPVAGG